MLDSSACVMPDKFASTSQEREHFLPAAGWKLYWMHGCSGHPQMQPRPRTFCRRLFKATQRRARCSGKGWPWGRASGLQTGVTTTICLTSSLASGSC